LKVIKFSLKTVTPMYNSRGGNEFSLLPQSIRGVMRFWFRAVLPRVIDVKKTIIKLWEK
jgi:CRISPR-associated protein Cmr1